MEKKTKELMQKAYDLNFKQALDIVLDGGAVKGENFVDGLFLKLNRHGQLVIVDASRFYEENERVFIKGLSQQKFRNLTVMTMKSLCG